MLTNKRRILKTHACIDNNLMAFIPTNGNLGFLFHMFSVIDLAMLTNPGAIPSVNETQIGEIIIPLPPLPEQQAIARYLDRETGRIDALIEKIEASIERWQEYRSALITAAVTGKIDVREESSGEGAKESNEAHLPL